MKKFVCLNFWGFKSKIIKLIFLLLCLTFNLLVFSQKANALEIVYPKTNPAKINANSTFFIGSAEPNSTLKINDIEVKTSQSGAFAQVVPLKCGKNTFKIVSIKESIDFIIEKAAVQAKKEKLSSIIEYPAIVFYVKEDNVPLRMTPVDCGINRMSHLPKDTQILINGEKGNFYRVFLNTKLTGWIDKSNVEQRNKTPDLITLKEFKTTEDKEFTYYEFDLNGKIPFSIKEENGLNLQLFNIYGENDNTRCLNLAMNKLVGYETYYEKNKFVLKIRKIPSICLETPFKNLIIAVDAGHGGKEYGAIGGCGDKEKDINLAIAQNLKKELENRGAKVIMTRDKDITLSLKDRIKKAKDKNSMLLISIHANALPDGQNPITNRGTSIYYYHPQAKPLAEKVLNSMTCELGIKNDKVRQGSLALVRPTESVSILVEVAYIINPEDYCLLIDKNFQQNCAKSIADGIEKYITNLDKK